MQLDLQSHKTQLVLTALAASAATASLFSLYNNHTRRQKRRTLNDDIIRALASKETNHKTPILDGPAMTQEPQAFTGDYSEELIREQLARNYAFFGEEGMEKIRRGKVVVIGCGGVGSWAAVMLVRS